MKNKKFEVRHVLFDLTNECNMACKHCYKNNNIIQEEISVDRCLSIYDRLNHIFGTDEVVLSGGEPTLYNDLEKLISGLRDREAKIKLNTNGLMLPEFIVDNPYKMMRIQVSLDGYNEESYKEVRGIDAFHQVVENAVKYKDAGMEVFFRSTITSNNMKNYRKFIDISKKSEIPLIMRPLMNTGTENQERIENSFSDLLKWKDEIISEGLIHYIGGEDFFVCTNCPLLCEEPYISVLSIDINGDVFPCSVLRTKYLHMGNIYRQEIDTVIDHFEVIQSRIINLINSDCCASCGFRKRFGEGNCIASCTFANKRCVLDLMEGKTIKEPV